LCFFKRDSYVSQKLNWFFDKSRGIELKLNFENFVRWHGGRAKILKVYKLNFENFVRWHGGRAKVLKVYKLNFENFVRWHGGRAKVLKVYRF